MKVLWNRIILGIFLFDLIFNFGCQNMNDDKGKKSQQMNAGLLWLALQHEIKLISITSISPETYIGHTKMYKMTLSSKYNMDGLPIAFAFFNRDDKRVFMGGISIIPSILAGDNSYDVEVKLPSEITESGDFEVIPIIDPNEVYQPKSKGELSKDYIPPKAKVIGTYKGTPDLSIEEFKMTDDIFVLPMTDDFTTASLRIRSICQNYKNATLKFKMIGPDNTERSIRVWDTELKGYTQELMISYLRDNIVSDVPVSLEINQSNIITYIESFGISDTPKKFDLVVEIIESNVSTVDLKEKRKLTIPINFMKDPPTAKNTYTDSVDSTRAYRNIKGYRSSGGDARAIRGEFGVNGGIGLNKTEGAYLRGIGYINTFVLNNNFQVFSAQLGVNLKPHLEYAESRFEIRAFGGFLYQSQIRVPKDNEPYEFSLLEKEYNPKEKSKKKIDRFLKKVNYDKEIQKVIVVVPIVFKFGIATTLGWKANGQLSYELLKFSTGPFATVVVSASAALGFSWANAGAKGEVSLVDSFLDNSINLTASYDENAKKITSSLFLDSTLKFSFLAGKVELFATVRIPYFCRPYFWGCETLYISAERSETIVQWGAPLNYDINLGKVNLINKSITTVAGLQTKDEVVVIRPKNFPDHCLTVEGASQNKKTRILIQPCENLQNQKFTKRAVLGTGKHFQFIAVHSGQCLGVWSKRSPNENFLGSNAIQHPCDGGNHYIFSSSEDDGNKFDGYPILSYEYQDQRALEYENLRFFGRVFMNNRTNSDFQKFTIE